MNQILKRWRSITIGFLLTTYLAMVVFMHQPIKIWLYTAIGWLLLLILIFLGTFIGILGVVLQTITRKQGPSIPFYRIAYKLGTKNTTLLNSYGLLLLHENKAEEALACFESALESSNYFLTTKTLHCNKGIALWKLDRIPEAIDAYLLALKTFGSEDQKFFTEPTFDGEGIDALVKDNRYFYPQDYTTLGFLYAISGNYEEATFFSKAAIANKKDYASAYDNLGQIEYYKNNLAEARSYFDQALSLNPDLPDSLYFMGLVATKTGDKKKAKEYLLKAKDCKLDGLNTISYGAIDKALKALENY